MSFFSHHANARQIGHLWTGYFRLFSLTRRNSLFVPKKAGPENGGDTIRKISHGICFPLPIDLNECGIETVSSGNNSFNGS